ncbi:hypothetical protein ACFOOM_07540 [Streptomyces echinoruber]|uniref:Uncharacterized protein n=1 Tax=Streptomyces echinoruber TaxID=68898 RepID=A0A918VA56_9ACTN|nr:hypothetical protein [Streptomyces echinoruber]GGZ80225.1 hypothetical protein GCM10010389_17460 [Streptomyces echinoruber]
MPSLPYYDITARSTEGEGLTVTVEFQPGGAIDEATRDSLLCTLADALAALPMVATVTGVNERTATVRTIR